MDAMVDGENQEVTAESPLSPGAPAVRDTWNKPTGEVPSGVPSIAGGAGGSGSGQAGSGGGKISTTYPPIFYARPGESWEQYWRTVTFWLASEGKSLPVEMRGPRLMQQLRERAGKIVQHLTVDEVTSIQGVDIIKREMEKSPIIRLLDNKKIDKRRQKFMKLARLPNESIESFINRAEIYRRENEASPAYRVGSCFYVGHLLDSCKLTRKDLALLKAACGGDIEDETKVISAMLELAEQFEGAPYCPIGRGEPQLDNEDQYLVQKPGSSSSASTSVSDPPSSNRRRPFPRARGGGGRFASSGRRRFRDALVAILEEDGDEDVLEETLAEVMGEDSVDEDEEKADNPGEMTEFTPPSTHDTFVTSGHPGEASGTISPLAEIYAQELKARNRVREIKKMRQYFQKETPGGPTAARGEHVKKWVAEQQKKEPCFICHQLGHWSQECPYRRRDKNVHAANVTFPVSPPQQQDWALLESLAASGVYMVSHDGRTVTGSGTLHPPEREPHQVFWAIDELDTRTHTKMIVDLGCMKTVAGTTWINRVVRKWKQRGWFLRVTPEEEQFRFGDGQVVTSQYSVMFEVTIAGIHGVLRVSVVHGNCPPLLSKPVCSELGLVIDTSSHTVSSRKHGVKAYGLEQSKGGHYVIPIDEDSELSWTSIDRGFEMPEHVEIQVFDAPRGSAIRTGDDLATPLPGLRLVHGDAPTTGAQAGGLRVVPDRMGKRGTGSGGGPARDVRRRSSGERAGGHGRLAESFEDGEEAGAESTHPEVFIAEPSSSRPEAAASQACFSQEDSSGRASISVYGIQASTDADEYGAAPGDDDADAGVHAGPEPGEARGPGPGTQQWTREDPGVHEGQEDAAEGEDCGIDGDEAPFPTLSRCSPTTPP